MFVSILKETILELKQIVFEGRNVDIEHYLEQVSETSRINYEQLEEVYNLILIWKEDDEANELLFAGKKPWSKAEEILALMYVEMYYNYVGKAKRQVVFEEIGVILDRTFQAIAFKYYEQTKRQENKEVVLKKMNQLRIDDIEDNDEVLLLEEDTFTKQPKIQEHQKTNDVDLITIISKLATNVETVGLDLSPLFEGMLNLSQRAVDSNPARLKELEGELEGLRAENEKLKEELSDIREIFQNFNSLSSTQKLQNLSDFNDKIKSRLETKQAVLSS